jgi:hypothetical protein
MADNTSNPNGSPGEFFDLDNPRIEFRSALSSGQSDRVFLVYDPSEYILSAFEAERSTRIGKPPGIRNNHCHLLVDLSTLDSLQALYLFIAQAIGEAFPTSESQSAVPPLNYQDILWRAWLELLIRTDYGFDIPRDADQASGSLGEKATGQLLYRFFQVRLEQFSESCASPTDYNNDKSSTFQLGLPASLPQFNRLNEFVVEMEGNQQDLDLLAKEKERIQNSHCLVLCITGISDREEAEFRTIHGQLRRMYRKLDLGAVLLINPPKCVQPSDSHVVRYPAIPHRDRHAWLAAAPLFLLPAEHKPVEQNDEPVASDETVFIEWQKDPLLTAFLAEPDGARVAWTAANGSLRALLRIARRAKEIAERLEDVK